MSDMCHMSDHVQPACRAFSAHEPVKIGPWAKKSARGQKYWPLGRNIGPWAEKSARGQSRFDPRAEYVRLTGRTCSVRR